MIFRGQKRPLHPALLLHPQIQLEKTKDNIDLISKDLNSATKRFFNTAESKRFVTSKHQLSETIFH